MHLSRDTGNAAWQNLSCLACKFSKNFRIKVADLLKRQINALTGHAAVRFAESNATFDSFWLGHKVSKFLVRF